MTAAERILGFVVFAAGVFVGTFYPPLMTALGIVLCEIILKVPGKMR